MFPCSPRHIDTVGRQCYPLERRIQELSSWWLVELNFHREKVIVSKVSSRASELTFKFKLGQVWRDRRPFYCSWLSPEASRCQVPFTSPKQVQKDFRRNLFQASRASSSPLSTARRCSTNSCITVTSYSSDLQRLSCKIQQMQTKQMHES